MNLAVGGIMLKQITRKSCRRKMAHQYKKETQREHVLNHSGMYIGSTESAEEYMWVYDVEKGKMLHRKCLYNPGLLKIIDEIIVNARDEYVRTTAAGAANPVKYIHVEAGVVDGAYTISVENDGAGIPVEIHPTEKIYVPEMIFGNMLTSSNYNQAEEKIVGGTFGVGSKASNIFSKEFTVEVKDPARGKSYKQSWTENMSKCGKAEIKKMTGTKGMVRITLKPDLARFQVSQE